MVLGRNLVFVGKLHKLVSFFNRKFFAATVHQFIQFPRLKWS